MACYVFRTQDNPDQASRNLTRWKPSVDDMYKIPVVDM